MTTNILDTLERLLNAHKIMTSSSNERVELTPLGWGQVLSCVTSWAGVCSTARMMREEERWRGYASILHFLLTETVNMPYYLLDLILRIQDCKGYPLGIYMCTDLDENGNFPLHIAAGNLDWSQSKAQVRLLERLMYADTDALFHANDDQKLPLHLLLQDIAAHAHAHAHDAHQFRIRTNKLVVFSKMCDALYEACDASELIDQVICAVFNSFYSPSSPGFLSRNRETIDDELQHHLHPDVLSNMLHGGYWPSNFLINDIVRLCPSSLAMITTRTKLYPFMTAAVHENSLDSVYLLLRQVPHLVSVTVVNAVDKRRNQGNERKGSGAYIGDKHVSKEKLYKQDNERDEYHGLNKKQRLPSPTSVMLDVDETIIEDLNKSDQCNDFSSTTSSPLIPWNKNTSAIDDDSAILYNGEISKWCQHLWM